MMILAGDVDKIFVPFDSVAQAVSLRAQTASLRYIRLRRANAARYY